jgi:hypothetical protein
MVEPTHIGQEVPMTCRFCGSKLVVGRKEFDHLGKKDFMGSSEYKYRILLVCPKRLVNFSFTYFLHDLREFSEDFKREYKI